MAKNAVLAVLALVLAVVAALAIVNMHPKPAPKAAMSNAALLLGPAPRSPHASFEDVAPPRVPDYAKDEAWAALPGKRDSADLVPAGDPLPDAQAMAGVDVFYIHPTTFRSGTAWVQDIGDTATNDWTDMSVIARQAGIFNACCKVYAPRYRQATIGALGSPESGMKAYAFAYQDVKRAFQYYIDHYNNGRPFILVGHSQGTFHLLPLLEEMIDQTPLKDRMVAAYAVGIGVPLGTFGHALKNITACDKPDQTGCVASWNSYTRDGDAATAIARTEEFYIKRFKTEDGKELLCTNPLTFDTAQPDAPATANLGSLPGIAADGPLPAVKPGLIGATCKNGMLFADTPTDPDFVLTVMPGGVLHMHDMDLYYQNIRANAVLRAETWLKAHPAG